MQSLKRDTLWITFQRVVEQPPEWLFLFCYLFLLLNKLPIHVIVLLLLNDKSTAGMLTNSRWPVTICHGCPSVTKWQVLCWLLYVNDPAEMFEKICSWPCSFGQSCHPGSPLACTHTEAGHRFVIYGGAPLPASRSTASQHRLAALMVTDVDLHHWMTRLKLYLCCGTLVIFSRGASFLYLFFLLSFFKEKKADTVTV